MSSTAGTTDVPTDPIIAAQRKKAQEIRQALLMWPESPVINETTIPAVSASTSEVEPAPRASFAFADFCKQGLDALVNSVLKPLVSWLFGYVDYSEGFEEITPDFSILQTVAVPNQPAIPATVEKVMVKPGSVVVPVTKLKIGDNVTFKYSSFSITDLIPPEMRTAGTSVQLGNASVLDIAPPRIQV